MAEGARPGLSPARGALGFIQRHRFIILLGFLALFLLSIPVVHHRRMTQGGQTLQDVLDSLLYAMMMAAAIYSVDKTRILFRLAIVLVALGVAAKGAYLAAPADWSLVAYHLLHILFLALVIYSITGYLFTSRQVDFNMISASLCCYLLLGVLWANLYSLVAWMIPGSFDVARVIGSAESMHFGSGHTTNPVYYSFVTLTTLGYGDIAPAKPAAQMLSVMEALTGQLYLVVIVARMVGLHIARESE